MVQVLILIGHEQYVGPKHYLCVYIASHFQLDMHPLSLSLQQTSNINSEDKMKPSFMFNLFLLSIILYQAQGMFSWTKYIQITYTYTYIH